MNSGDVLFVNWGQTDFQKYPKYEIEQNVQEKDSNPEDFGEEAEEAPVILDDVKVDFVGPGGFDGNILAKTHSANDCK